jgi:hypothetical protein
MTRPTLNPERTDLAWRRTALTATVTGLLAVRAVVLSWPAPVAATAVVALAGAVGAIAAIGGRRGEVLTGPPLRVASRRIWIPAIAAVAVAALGLAAILT